MHSESLPPSMVSGSDAEYEIPFLHNLYWNSDLRYEGLGVQQNHLLGSRDEDHWQSRMSGMCLCQINSLVWVESCTIGHEGEAFLVSPTVSWEYKGTPARKRSHDEVLFHA